ncbi:MAG: replicative DNA helicase [Treponema sp.]|nr:replicative DNA helicase [Treponema sp.]
MASLKDKVPPHNLEAEQATLGALLYDWDAVGTVIRFLRADRFYSLQNQKIFSAILRLYNRGQIGDLLTIIEELRQSGELDAAGGVAYVSELTDKVPTSANVEYYAQIVLEHSIRRSLIKISSSIIAKAHDETSECVDILEESQKLIFDLSDSRSTTTYKSLQELVSPTIENIEKIYKHRGDYTGIPAGFSDLDNMTSGFQKSELIIIGARPSIGKTALALTMAADIAIHKKIPTGFMSLEMSDMQLMQRLVAMEANIRADLIRNGRLSINDFKQIQDAAARMYEAPLYIIDTPNMKLLDVRAIARRLKLQKNIQILFIDYIGLIGNENSNIPRHEQIAEISRSLKSLARELEIPVVVLSQVRRDAEGQAPGLADLRESGAIEQDADLVMFLHRERKSNNTEEESGGKFAPVMTKLILAKQRNGPIGDIEILYLPQITKFVNKDKYH